VDLRPMLVRIQPTEQSILAFDKEVIKI